MRENLDESGSLELFDFGGNCFARRAKVGEQRALRHNDDASTVRARVQKRQKSLRHAFGMLVGSPSFGNAV